LKTVNLSNKAWPTLVRLAVATIWAYAGIFEKLLNPGFLNPASTSYVGITVQYLAEGSPIRGFLYAVVFPHVLLVGELVMVGEVSFAILTFLGLANRLSGTVAFYTNLIYFLSAYWTGTEEYGINLLLMIFDAFLVINGPGPLSLDWLISRRSRIMNMSLLWFSIGTILYLSVILFLLFY